MLGLLKDSTECYLAVGHVERTDWRALEYLRKSIVTGIIPNKHGQVAHATSMKSRLLALIGIFVLSLPGLAGQSDRAASVSDIAVAGRKVALVIGNKDYRPRALVNPLNDATDMKAALERFGFAVTMRPNLAMRAMDEAISKFVAELRKGDVALFYFSGHGMQIDGENLLLPIDFDALSAEDSKKNSIRFDDIQRLLEKSPALLSILVMDACRNNPFLTTRGLIAQGMAPVEARMGSYVVFAASPGQTADDNPRERNGLFTKFLLENLRDPPALSQLFRRVRDAVYKESQHYQMPAIQDQILGDFYFVPPVVATTSVAAKKSVNDLLEEGKILYAEGKCEAANEYFQRAVRSEPENAFAHNAVGLAYVCRSLRASAIQSFNMAITLSPDMASAYFNRGNVYKAEGRYKLAVQDFDWAIEQESRNSLYLTRRGDAYFRDRKYDEAIADFNHAIELNSSDAEALYGRGQVRHRLGQYREAIEDYQAAKKLKPTLPGLQESLQSAEQQLRFRGR